MTPSRPLLIAALGLGIVLGLGGPTEAGVSDPNLWPTRQIHLVVCDSLQIPRGDPKHCSKVRPLSEAMAIRVRESIDLWNQALGQHIQLVEVQSFQRDTVIVGRDFESDKCNVNGTGYVRAREMVVTIGDSCETRGLTRHGTVLHEFGHVVGLHHEQRRPDRDAYLAVDQRLLQQWARTSSAGHEAAYQYSRLCDDRLPQSCTSDVNPTSEGGFSQFGTRYGRSIGPYDFNSIMHYALRPPSLGGPSVGLTSAGLARVAEQQREGLSVGQRDRFSEGDIAAIRSMYP